MHIGADNPETAAILAGDGDGEQIAGMLREDGIAAIVRRDLASLVPELGRCGFGILMEDALGTGDLAGLLGRIEAQPDWSDYPFIVLTGRSSGPDRMPVARRLMGALGNVTFLEQPFHPATVVSIARTALASRKRQYQARDRLRALEASRAEIALRDERLTFALAAGKLGSWEIDFPDRTLVASDLCKQNFGLGPAEELSYERLIAIIHPEDRDMVVAAAQRAIDTATDFEVDCRFVTPAEETRWVEIRGRATYRDGRANRMAGVSLDVTGRKLAEERQQLLIRELHHRVKNTLATVQALVGSTARGATSIEGFYKDFTGRIMSLANTHTILTEEFWQQADLNDLVAKELDLFDKGHDRIKVSGPRIVLPSQFAVPLGMAFHELMTNAAKYGALSDGHGRVSVNWALEPSPEAPRVQLRWVEEDGPAVAAPVRKGFGTQLLERVLTAQMRAKVAIDYDPRGVRVSMSFALPGRNDGEARQP